MTISGRAFTSYDAIMTALSLVIGTISGWFLWSVFSLLWPHVTLIALFLAFLLTHWVFFYLFGWLAERWRRSRGNPSFTEERAAWPFMRRYASSIGLALGAMVSVLQYPMGAF